MVNKLKIAFIVGKNTDFTYINKKLMKLNSYKLAPKWFKEGIKKYQINVNRICTYSNPRLFNSYRRNKTSSRQWSCIYS